MELVAGVGAGHGHGVVVLSADEDPTQNYDVDTTDISIAIVAIIMPVALGVLLAFWYYRDLYPIRGRLVSNIAITYISCVLFIPIIMGKGISPNFPCWLVYTGGMFFTVAIPMSYMVRIVRLFFRFELSIAQLKEEQLFEDIRSEDSVSAASSTHQGPVPLSVFPKQESAPARVRSRDSKRKATHGAPSPHNIYDEDLELAPLQSDSAVVSLGPSRNFKKLSVSSSAALASKARRSTGGSLSMPTPSAAESPAAVSEKELAREERRVRRSRRASVRLRQLLEVDHTKDKPPQYVWFLEHRYLISRRYLLLMWTAGVLAFLLPWFIVFGIRQPPEENYGNCTDYSEGDIFIGCASLLCIIAGLWSAYYLREVIDGLALKAELQASGIVSLVLMILWLIGISWAPISQDVFPFHRLLIVLLLVHLMAQLCAIPLVRAFVQKPTLDTSELPNIGTLSGVLNHPVFVRAFRQHLTKEFSLENLVFFEEVELYRQIVWELEEQLFTLMEESKADALPEHEEADDSATVRHIQRRDRAAEIRSQIEQHALDVYEKCVQVDAPYEVNIPFQIRWPIEECILPLRRRRRGTEKPTVDKVPSWMKHRRAKAEIHRRSRESRGDRAPPNPHMSPESQQSASVLPRGSVPARRLTRSLSENNGSVQSSGGSLDSLAGTLGDNQRVTGPVAVQVERRLSRGSEEDILDGGRHSSTDEKTSVSTSKRRYSDQDIRARSSDALKLVVDHTLFDNAQHSVYSLMETDSFARFCSTDEYRRLTRQFLDQDLQHQMNRAFQATTV